MQRTTDIYIALLERQFALEPGIFANSTVEIEEAIGGHTVPPAVREAITKHFAGKVRVRWYLQHVFTPRDDVVDVRLPTLPHGRRLLVS